jgi:hypothetical protein
VQPAGGTQPFSIDPKPSFVAYPVSLLMMPTISKPPAEFAKLAAQKDLTKFGILQPASASRLDIGIKLKGQAPTSRFEAAGD